ncbi:MAG: radical SAM family heme chaperone HemW [Pirellulaceae bacterium]|jgi:oxygen-independent coproporphyrinogen-3 oxidase|nr:radical SAM family heme chaperone HemW [Pirellulaceae bacterium]MDP7014910.1 radical SAM family heme chaperone HemW [Pirellulaceae bacterium]
MNAAPRSAYLHVPFCRRRCGYCNFTVVAGRDDFRDDYLDALQRELALPADVGEMDTIYIGGGTPTQFDNRQLIRLLDMVRNHLPLRDGGEFSVEANPEDIDQERLGILLAGGVNRLSLGAQSFHDGKLRTLERSHRARDIEAACELAAASGLNLSLDLIFAAPGENLEMWRGDLESALDCRPFHLSTYGLTFEKGAAFWSRRERGDLSAVENGVEADMYELAIDLLSAAGYRHYEVSNFARDGRECRHNEQCWLCRPYLAFGAGAARFVGGRRERNHRSAFTYARRIAAGLSPCEESEEISPQLYARERFVFGLRRGAGVEAAQWESETGFRIADLFEPACSRFVDLDLLERRAGSIRLTRRGLLVSDSLWPEFL